MNGDSMRMYSGKCLGVLIECKHGNLVQPLIQSGYLVCLVCMNRIVGVQLKRRQVGAGDDPTRGK